MSFQKSSDCPQAISQVKTSENRHPYAPWTIKVQGALLLPIQLKTGQLRSPTPIAARIRTGTNLPTRCPTAHPIRHIHTPRQPNPIWVTKRLCQSPHTSITAPKPKMDARLYIRRAFEIHPGTQIKTGRQNGYSERVLYSHGNPMLVSKPKRTNC